MNTCPRCQNPTDETDNYCRHCGRSLKPGTGFLFSHTGIILLAFVLGPFALPFVWMSKTIGLGAKWIYTALLALISVYFFMVCYRSFLMLQEAAQTLMTVPL